MGVCPLTAPIATLLERRATVAVAQDWAKRFEQQTQGEKKLK